LHSSYITTTTTTKATTTTATTTTAASTPMALTTTMYNVKSRKIHFHWQKNAYEQEKIAITQIECQ